jgi:hypothetical protein
MSWLAEISDREHLYTYFDSYTLQKKEELNRRSLEPGQGLIKAYLIETSATAEVSDVVPSFAKAGWQLTPIDVGLYKVANLIEDMPAVVDMLNPRYGSIYTTAPSALTDPIVKQMVRQSIELDHVWLSSPILSSIWQQLADPRSTKYANLLYEKESRFEQLPALALDETLEDNAEVESDSEAETTRERPVSRIDVKGRIRELRPLFGEASPLGDLTANLTRVRMPAPNGLGRYEYFVNGKLTDRGSEFRGFASQLRFLLTDIYGALTQRIEDTIVFSLERQSGGSGHERWAVKGAPVTFIFRRPLSEHDFRRFIEVTFEQGVGPFRLWGNPLWRSGPKVHVYGVDLHLWQQIYLDLSPSRFIVILPEGTCGNTVHRLAANIQRFLDPEVEIFIGDTAYRTLVKGAWETA